MAVQMSVFYSPVKLLSRLALAFFAVVFFASSGFGVSHPQLPGKYREWLEKDVSYIITNEEKKSFSDLTTDADRDRFIEHFWEVRNPTPGSPDNTYRTEHYRRLEYANQYFGYTSHTPGWQTDMGRIYITLGEPSQRQKLMGLQKITPMEVWFYSNSNPALPPFFYVIFYQRDPTDEFRLYHPYSDGPEKLITAMAGPSRQDALKTISDDAGRDVARETLSLIPDEPIDYSSATPSLASDVMLATIRNLANNPISKANLANRRRLLEDVTHRVVLGDEYLDAVTVVLRDPSGNTNLHYLLRLKKPDDFTVGQSATKGFYYSVLVSIKIQGADGKVIFSDEKKLSNSLSSSDFDDLKGKIFGYEGLLPLPPGKYKIQFELSNLLGSIAFHRDIDVTVPDVAAGSLALSDIVPFISAQSVGASAHRLDPFTGAGVKFLPRAGGELQLIQGEPLRFFYQVWVPIAQAPHSEKHIDVEYVYGRLGAQDAKTISDQLPLNQVDRGGSVISGKQILTADLAPGNYRLLVTLHDPESQAKVYRSFNFTVITAGGPPPAWDVSETASDAGELDWQRALCYSAGNQTPEALAWFGAAYSADPLNERYRDKLIDLYFDQKNYAKAVELYAAGGLRESTDEQTILRLAESFLGLGNQAKAIAVMESGATLNPKSAPLQLGLAEFYRKAGNLQKAEAAEKRGKQLMDASPSS
jgi:GWxTD domain-containing protein